MLLTPCFWTMSLLAPLLTSKVPNPGRPVVCSSAYWPSDNQIGSCGRNSCRWRGRSRRIQASGTSAPASVPVSGSGPPSDILTGCKGRRNGFWKFRSERCEFSEHRTPRREGTDIDARTWLSFCQSSGVQTWSRVVR